MDLERGGGGAGERGEGGRRGGDWGRFFVKLGGRCEQKRKGVWWERRRVWVGGGAGKTKKTRN